MLDDKFSALPVIVRQSKPAEVCVCNGWGIHCLVILCCISVCAVVDSVLILQTFQHTCTSQDSVACEYSLLYTIYLLINAP